MNNEQFRKLLLEKEASKNDDTKNNNNSPSARPGATPSALGTKKSSFIPMTPRTVKGSAGVDFARQVLERNKATNSGGGGKKFKSSAAPKGSRLASGYQDRTLERRDFDDDEKGARIKALEEQMKLGQLDQATFEALRDEITGGDITATHLVKGLDRKLLERIRRGEDVTGSAPQNGEEKDDAEQDVDEELDRLEEKEVARIEREKTDKRGETAAPLSVAGAKRSRDQILAELKAQRKAAAEARLAARPELGSAFRDVGAKRQSAPHIERDDKGREVMITVDEHGNVKKKVRKVQATESVDDVSHAAATVEKPLKFLDEGITLPTLKEQKKEAPKEESEDEGDIFGDVGTEYNPLGDVGDSDDSDSDEEGQLAPTSNEKPAVSKSPTSSASPVVNAGESKDTMPPPPVPQPTQQQEKPISNIASRNYFKTSKTDSITEASAPQNPFNDVNFLAAIKKASALSNVSFSLGGSSKDAGDGDGDDEEAAAREAKLKRRAAMLANDDRDLEDMDMGFGSSRVDDDEDADEGGSKIKLSQWKGGAGGGDEDDDGDDGDGGQKGRGGEKKKRSRRRKGDKNSAKDVLGVLERRKEGEK